MNFDTIAKAYARLLPANSIMDWEDMRQEMMIGSMLYGSIQSVRWEGARCLRRERVRARPVPHLTWVEKRPARFDTICELAEYLERWPWLIGYAYGDRTQDIAEREGVTKQTISRRTVALRKTIREEHDASELNKMCTGLSEPGEAFP